MGSSGCGYAVAGVLIFGIVGAIPIAMICLGALHLNECNMEPWVPKFMIVAGGAGLLTVILAACAFGCSAKDGNGAGTCLFVLVGLITLFSFAWNIAGSVWVFKKWSNWDNVKDLPGQGCRNDLYLFAFAYLIIFWITCPCTFGGGAKMGTSSA